MRYAQSYIGLILSKASEDAYKLDNKPSLNDKMALIWRIFIAMVHIYNLGEDEHVRARIG